MIVCHTSEVAAQRGACRTLKRVRRAARQSILPAKGLGETVLNIIGRLNEQHTMLGAARRGAADAAHQGWAPPRAPGHRSSGTEDQRMPEDQSA
jgi:hypothetical protein